MGLFLLGHNGPYWTLNGLLLAHTCANKWALNGLFLAHTCADKWAFIGPQISFLGLKMATVGLYMGFRWAVMRVLLGHKNWPLLGHKMGSCWATKWALVGPYRRLLSAAGPLYGL